MADQETGIRFKLGDDEYVIPSVDDFDMDEWQIVYSYSGLVLDDFAPVDDEDAEAARQRLVGQPAFMRSLLHIGYRRAHPDVKDADVRRITGEAKMTSLFDVEQDDAGPPEMTDPVSVLESSPSGNGSESSGSVESSDEPESLPAPTGTPV